MDNPAKIVSKPNRPGYNALYYYKDGKIHRDKGPAVITQYRILVKDVV